MKLSRLFQLIDAGTIPSAILIGGDSEFLTSRAFSETRDRIVAAVPSILVEAFSETTDLTNVIDSFRTQSLFGGRRLLTVPEVHAFVSKKEVQSLYEKAVTDWNSAKTERKRNSSLAKLLHLVGLTGLDLEAGNHTIASALGAGDDATLSEMLEVARSTGKKATRGESDAALLTEAVVRGGAAGTILLMKSGSLPGDSATLRAIEKEGAVVECNLSREEFNAAMSTALAEITEESGARFDERAAAVLRSRMGIERMLSDKFSKDVPDLRLVLAEASRLATLAGAGGNVTAALVEREVGSIGGGARYELASLFAERKPMEAIAKLRDLVAQSRRDDPKTPTDIHFGKFLFAIADEIRQLVGILTWIRRKKLDRSRSVPYNRFKDSLADDLSAFLKSRGLIKQKPHPFALHKRFEAARMHDEQLLLSLLSAVAEAEFQRKCGGYAAEIGIEVAILGSAR